MNPWLNISLSDTVADCDKPKINSLTTAVKSKITPIRDKISISCM